jgi:hypothetical protein
VGKEGMKKEERGREEIEVSKGGGKVDIYIR